MGHGRDTKGDRERRHHVVQERLRTHLAVTSALAEAQTLAEAAPRLLEVVCRGLDWELGALWRIDSDEQVIRCVDLWHLPGTPLVGFSLATRHAVFARGEGLPGRVWQDGVPLWVPDIGADPGQQRGAQAAREDIHAALALPVTAYGEVTGVMEFFSSRVREPDEELMALLTGIGSLVGQFIRHRDAERDVRASEARKSAIVNAAFECIIGLDAHGRVTEFNPAAELTFARSRDEAIGLSITDLLVVDRLDEPHRADIEALLAGQLPRLLGLPTEAIGRRSDGREFPVELAITQIDLPGPPSFTVYLRDVTASRAAQAAMRHLAAIVETTNDAILSKTLGGTILTWNRGAELLYGYAAEEAVGRAAGMLATEEGVDEIAELI
jgi:sigma-B regulation protein RsbU (phosphoserine phosphatase)